MKTQTLKQQPIAGDDLPAGTFVPLSRYKNIVNFVNDQNQFVYITSNQDFLASNALFLPAINIAAVASLAISSETIVVDQICIDRNKMAIYDSTMNYDGVDFEDFELQLLHLSADESHLFPEKSLIFLLNPANEKLFSSGFDRQFMLNAKKSAGLILSGSIVKGIETIKGTGYGLTPSGDDFIAGFLLGLHYNECRYNIDLSGFREEIYHAALGKNLLISSFLLRAKNKKYFNPLKKILLLLAGASQSSLSEGLQQLLSIGATSGADFFSGYIFPIKHKTGL
ncbi:MAG: DUF2877 domain-containing protein [Bacteroidetes bacterium]|nr:DUF2877 domain-containing protein [Bacteroidota bacterium]